MSLVSETVPKIVVLRLIHLFDLCVGEVIKTIFIYSYMCSIWGLSVLSMPLFGCTMLL